MTESNFSFSFLLFEISSFLLKVSMIFFAVSKSSFEWSIVKSFCCSAISLWLFITSLKINFDDTQKKGRQFKRTLPGGASVFCCFPWV